MRGAWEGILLENWPYFEEETIIQLPPNMPESIERRRYQALCVPHLRFQDFNSIEDEMINMQHEDVQYLIDGTWLSFAQIMEG